MELGERARDYGHLVERWWLCTQLCTDSEGIYVFLFVRELKKIRKSLERVQYNRRAEAIFVTRIAVSVNTCKNH